jgi:hypothetical protein
MSTSFITPGYVRAFQAVTSQIYGDMTLASCLINGKPGVAIVRVNSPSCPCWLPSPTIWISSSKT